jgi:hypothetical protein
LRWECPPEGAKDLQGYVIETKKHISPVGSMGFHRFEFAQEGGEFGGTEALKTESREKGGRGELLTEGKSAVEVAGVQQGRSPPVKLAGGGKSPLDRERGCWEKERGLWPGSGWRLFFKTRDGHTGQTTVVVRCTPDSAQ